MALGRPKTITTPGAGTTVYTYTGSQVELTTGSGARTQYDLTAFGQVAVTREYSGSDVYTTSYGYEPLGQLAAITDTLGNTTRMRYDGLGRKIEQNDMDMGTWQYQYDPNGNLATQIDARQVVLTFTYDALNRLAGKTYDTGAATGVAATTPVTYTYTGHRRTGLVDGSGYTGWGYDALGRLLTETKAISSQQGLQVFTTSYRYDNLNRLQQMIYPDGEVVTTTYDARGLPKTVASTATTYLADAAYNPLGQPVTWRLGGVVTQSISYDPATFQPATASANGGSLQHLTFGFQVGHLQTYSDTLRGFDLTYGYDALNRLASLAAPGLASHTYGYDPIGNLTLARTLALTYPLAGQPQPHAPTGDSNEVSYSYDDNGNLTARGATITYKYDAENRLAEVISDSQVTAFVYDGDGRRVKQVAPDGKETLYPGEHYQITWNWSDYTPVFAPVTDGQLNPDLVSDDTGQLYLVWVEQHVTTSTTTSKVRLATRDPETGVWTAEDVVTGLAGTNIRPVVALDPATPTVHVAWLNYDYFASTYDLHTGLMTGSGWQETLAITGSVGSYSNDIRKPALTIAPDGGGAYLAWSDYLTSTGQTIIRVWSNAGGTWTQVYTSPAGNDQHLPALAADEVGNIYLAYAEDDGSTHDLWVIYRDSVSSSWSSSEFVADFDNNYQRVSAIYQADYLLVGWGGANRNFQIKQRVAANQWVTQLVEALSSCGFDLMMTETGLEWLLGYMQDSGTSFIVSNKGEIARDDGDTEDACEPTLTAGSNRTLVAVWQAEDLLNIPQKSHLYLSTFPASTIKRYSAGGHQVALKVDDQLYYPLTDPTGDSLLFTDANGAEAGHILYDPYGGVLTSTLSATLTTVLAEQGTTADPATGLVYQGNGRFYDPVLGRPLQPDPSGGVPILPQSLSRYGATPLGAPGVAEGVSSGGLDFLSSIAWTGVAGNTGLEITGRKTLVEASHLILRGSGPALQRALAGKELPFEVAAAGFRGGRLGELVLGASGYLPWIGQWVQQKLANRLVILEVAIHSHEGLIKKVG